MLMMMMMTMMMMMMMMMIWLGGCEGSVKKTVVIKKRKDADDMM